MPRTKVKPGWTKYTNLSVKEKDYKRLRRMFETYYTGSLQWIDWLNVMTESMIMRYDILKKRYPHLKLVASSAGFIIEDTKKKQIVRVSDLDNVKPEYLMFALLHPEFRL